MGSARSSSLLAAVALAALLGAPGCRDRQPRVDFGPRFFSGPGRVQCSKGLDREHEWKPEMLAASLAYARDAGVVLHTFGHAPKLDLDAYLADFDWAASHGVPMVTFRDLAAGHRGAGWAFTVDDDEVDTWFGWRETLRAHRVKVTFFVSHYDQLGAAQHAELRALADDGHDIEPHGKAHANAVDYAAAHGVERYRQDEVLPSKAALVADGYAPVAFAYPFGAHTAEIDAALLGDFALLRTTGGAWCLK